MSYHLNFGFNILNVMAQRTQSLLVCCINVSWIDFRVLNIFETTYVVYLCSYRKKYVLMINALYLLLGIK